MFLLFLDLPRSGIREGDHGVVGVLHPSQTGLQMVGRASKTKGEYQSMKDLQSFIVIVSFRHLFALRKTSARVLNTYKNKTKPQNRNFIIGSFG